MRNILISLVAVLLLGAAFGTSAQAQAVTNPVLASPLFSIEVLQSAKTYINGQIDTLYSPATGTFIQAGGATHLSLTIQTRDTCRALVFVDYRPRGSSETFSTYNDSVVVTKEGGFKEITIKSSTVERFTGIDEELRVRIQFANGGAGVTNGVTAGNYDVRMNYKRNF